MLTPKSSAAESLVIAEADARGEVVAVQSTVTRDPKGLLQLVLRVQ